MNKIISIASLVSMVGTIWFLRSNIFQKVIRYFDKITIKRSIRFVLIILIIIIISYFIPMFKIEAQYYSVVDFIRQGSIAFSIALTGYILAIILLLVTNRISYIISCGLVFASWFFAFGGAMRNIPNESINIINPFIAFFSVFSLVLLPLVCILFYNQLMQANKKTNQ